MSAILTYCQTYSLNPDTVKRIVWAVDKVLLAHWKSADESEKRRREFLEANKPRPAIGGSRT